MRLKHFVPFLVVSSIVSCSPRSGDDGSGRPVRAVPGGPCRADSECISTETCQSGTCAPPPTSGCTTDADCAAGESCISGACTAMTPPACTSDADCPLRQSCVNGACTIPTPACIVDADCASGESCVAGVCTPSTNPICASDADCSRGEVCTNGQCTPSTTPICQSDADCATGEICRADGVCVPDPWACTTNADCPGRGSYICHNGQCGPSNTFGCNGRNCPCDLIDQNCSNGLRCYPDGDARSDGQCYGQGGVNVGGACVEPPLGEPEACIGASVCAYENESDPTGLCIALCLIDSDCASGEVCRHLNDPFGTGQTTEWGLCVVPPVIPPPPCDALAQNCAAGEMCVPRDLTPNECLPAGNGAEGSSCQSAADCAPGIACVAIAGSSPMITYFTLLQAYIDRGGGTCKTLCTPGGACSGGQACAPILPSQTGVQRSDLGVCD